MTVSPLEEQRQQGQIDWQSLTIEQKSRMLCSHVEGDQGARIYFSIHTKMRSFVYTQAYIAESYRRAEALEIIKESYFPILVKDFVKWQRSNGKKMTKDDVELFKHPAVKYTTSELLLFWLEQEAKTLWQENRESRFKRLYGY
jgi:hypothetical protein